LLSITGAPHDGQDTVRTVRTIIWYKRTKTVLVLGKFATNFSSLTRILPEGRERKYRRKSFKLENFVLELKYLRVTKALNETSASSGVYR